jgi:osmotically-inducible protein OsmY
MSLSKPGHLLMKTDAQVQKDVIAELNWEPSVDPTDIGVEVKDGVVTLAGHVSSYSEKWNAERSALRVSGVKALAVEMDVALPGLSKRTDADIARSVENVLQWIAFLPQDAIKVMVEDSWITLTGNVAWEYQRQSAIDAVRNLMGVRGVSDDITIKAEVSSTLVKEDIEAALKRRALDDAQGIFVEVNGTDVTLTGTVHSWTERDLATHSAWCTPGVSDVKDRMTLA